MNIHICGLDKENSSNNISQLKILNTLFPKTDKKLSTSNYLVNYNEKGSWNSFIYLEQNTYDFKFIKETILKQIKKYEILDEKEKEINEDLKNHIIILFVSNNLDKLFLEEFNKEETIENLNENFPLILFLFKDTDRENLYYKDEFFDFSYIDCINLKKITSERNDELCDEDYIALYLQTLLYKRYDSYFTERGYQIINEINPVSNEPNPGIYLPIILCGTPGVGKSTFINVFAGHRISKASSSQQGVTTKSSIYDVKIPGNNYEEHQIDTDVIKQEAYLRFIDTPGFDLEKDIDIVQKEINEIFKEFKEVKERIPVILYFLNPIGRNFSKEDAKSKKIFNMLKFLKNNN